MRGGFASRFWTSLKGHLAATFSLDLRSLAIFRIGMGLLVLADAGVALTNAEMLYSDAGVMPLSLLHERHWHSVASWSLHALSGSVELQAVLMVLQMLAGLWLIAGRFTRLATIACWVLVCSLETRNPVVTNGADVMTRLLLFWGMFLPLGARWSLDAARGKAGPTAGASSLRSVATAALLLQVALVYWFSVACKTHECWWGDGSALVQTLQLDLFARPFGVWLRGHAELCRMMTYGWLVVEVVGPFLLFLPFWRTGLRCVAVLLFMSFHAGIELCMDIGAFPFVMIVAWSVFLPGAVWSKLQATTLKLQGMINTQVLKQHQSRQSSALNIGFWSFGAWMLKLEPSVSGAHSLVPSARPSLSSRLANVLCLAALVFVFLWNLRGTNFAYWERFFPREVNPVAFALRLDQHWSMFSPRPSSEDGWFVLRAGMSDGSEVDLLRDGAPVDFKKPALVSATFKDARWQKLYMNVWMDEYRHLREPVCNAVARKWNATHGGLSQIVAWQLWYMLEPTLPDGSAGPVKPSLLFDCERFEGGALPASASEKESLRASSP